MSNHLKIIFQFKMNRLNVKWNGGYNELIDHVENLLEWFLRFDGECLEVKWQVVKKCDVMLLMFSSFYLLQIKIRDEKLSLNEC